MKYINSIFSRYTAVIFSLLFFVESSYSQQRIVRPTFGWKERVSFSDFGVNIHAKLDTGADSCSVNASDIKIKTNKNTGKKKVTFTLEDNTGKNHRLTLPVTRVAKIKRHFGHSQTRYVVSLGLCLGNKYMVTEVNLVDRSGFTVPMLIGRNFLAPNAVVDSANIYMSSPTCAKQEILQ